MTDTMSRSLIAGLLLAAAFGLHGPASAAAARGAGASCPSHDFSKFVIAFSNSAMLQKLYSQSPLRYDRVVDQGEPEPRIITRSVERAAPAYFDMLSSAATGKEKLEQKVTAQGRHQATLILSRPDTDYQVEYLFRRNAGCWQLQRITDYSL